MVLIVIAFVPMMGLLYDGVGAWGVWEKIQPDRPWDLGGYSGAKVRGEIIKRGEGKKKDRTSEEINDLQYHGILLQ